jgi:hypothetical protein
VFAALFAALLASLAGLFKLVSLLTGWKNALKGVGYFIGAALLDSDEVHGYTIALSVLVGLVLLAFPWAIFGAREPRRDALFALFFAREEMRARSSRSTRAPARPRAPTLPLVSRPPSTTHVSARARSHPPTTLARGRSRAAARRAQASTSRWARPRRSRPSCARSSATLTTISTCSRKRALAPGPSRRATARAG